MKWLVVSVLLLISSLGIAQVNADEVKGAIILQICENVEWPKSKANDFIIGFLSNDLEVFKTLKPIESSLKIHKKPVKLISASTFTDLLHCNAVYFNKFSTSNMSWIFNEARKNNILLITDNYTDPLNIHVNLIQEGARLAFKINMSNLTLAKLTVKPNILLNGGSVVDIKTAFEEFDIRLKEGREKIIASEKELLQKEALLQNKDILIKEKEAISQQYVFEIDSLSNETNKRALLAEKRKEELDQKIEEINIKNEELDSIYQDINNKQKELNHLKKDIEASQKEASLLKDEVSQKNKVLIEKEEYIDSQHRIILLSISMLAGFMLAAFAISRLFFIKRKLNIKLQTANSELQEANEELNTKNEIIHGQNDELNATIDHLKETQSQLIQAEKMASLGVLTSGIAHEINNPLNFILGGYHILNDYHKQKRVEEKTVTDALSFINEGVTRANNIVQGLDAFCSTSEKFDEPCTIDYILDNCLIIVGGNMSGKISVVKEYDKKLPVFMGNSTKLHQAFLNILMNASQAIGEQGEIKLSVHYDRDIITVCVIDNGVGISNDDINRVTDPFFTTKSPGEGTGLGLSITYSIIQEHHGTFNIESELGKYTKVEVSFPLR